MALDILALAGQQRQYLVDTRRHLHQNPELSYQEYETAAFIRAALHTMGVPWEAVGETGTLARLVGAGRPQGTSPATPRRVLLRADIDALPITEQADCAFKSQNPGVMHACGHDGHTAALLGAARMLAGLRQAFCGEVLFAFQPAEEFGRGSQHFLAPGVLPPLHRVFGLHLTPEYPGGHVALNPGPDAAACDYFKITVQGRAAHISKPQLGVDAVQIAAALTPRLKALPSHICEPFDTALVGVGRIDAGTSYNVVAAAAVLEGTVRALSDETQQRLKAGVERVATETAESFGGTAEVEFQFFTSALVNDNDAYEEARAAALALVGAERLHTNTGAPLMGLAGDDFSEYLHAFKGCYAHVGIANAAIPGAGLPLHADRFAMDESCLPTAAALHVAYALQVLGTGEAPAAAAQTPAAPGVAQGGR